MIDFEGIFWSLKSLFPGDPDFSWRNFWDLPFCYVLDAVHYGALNRQKTLHEEERPIALQSSILANQSRDPKRKKEPYSWEDFAMYRPKEDENLPDGRYGSAMLKAFRDKRLPAWALFCFKELASAADKGYEPSEAILVSSDAVLLHPTITAGGWTGLLIAQESASNQLRVFRDSAGISHRLTVPFIETKIVAIEDVVLRS